MKPKENTMKLNCIKLLSFLLALLLLSGTLLACTPVEGGNDGTPPVTGEDNENNPNRPDIPHKEITGLAEYTIVRNEFGGSAEKNAAIDLSSLMRDSCGLANIVTDWIEAVEKEIIIGATKRPESVAAAEWVATQVTEGQDWYYIGIADNNKIVLTGSDDSGIAAAVRYLIMTYGEEIKTGTASLPEQLLTVYQNDVPTLVTTERGEGGKPSTFVATILMGTTPYYPDPTGVKDVTDMLKEALTKVGKMGGGMVFLPGGIYRISDTLTLPQNVTLQGEYVDPDTGDFSQGTVLLLDQKGSFKTKNAIVMSQGALAAGLTFYYEGQDLSNPIPYKATITCTNGQGAWEIRDITLLNSYIGIDNNTSPNGMVTLDNIKGTVLHTAYSMEHRADISIGTNLCFSPKYWAAAGEKWNAPAEADIRAYMKSIDSVGFYMGDIDRDTYENVTLDGYKTGIYNREKTRAGLSGSYYNLQILDAEIGIATYGLDDRYGLLVVNAKIEASKTAVINDTPTELAFCQVHLLNSEISGKTVGDVHIYSSEDGADDTEYTAYNRTPARPGEKLFNLATYEGVDTTGKTDVSAALQKALDDAAAAGGGIVYLPAGRYLLANPVTITGNNVQLAGCNISTHTQNGALDTASILMVTYGRDGDENSTAAITVSGQNSGLRGLSVIYPENGVSAANYETQTLAYYSYFVRATGKGSYVKDMCMVAVSRAVHFDGADNFICDRLLMTVWDNGVKATNCSRGLISRIHTNGTYHTLGSACISVLGKDWTYDGAEVVTKVLDTHIINRLTLFKVNGCSDLQMTHVFHYGAFCYMEAKDSDIWVLNGESSRLTGISFALQGDVDLEVINFMRPNPSEFMSEEGEKGNYVYLYNWGAAHWGGDRVMVIEPQ